MSGRPYRQPFCAVQEVTRLLELASTREVGRASRLNLVRVRVRRRWWHPNPNLNPNPNRSDLVEVEEDRGEAVVRVALLAPLAAVLSGVEEVVMRRVVLPWQVAQHLVRVRVRVGVTVRVTVRVRVRVRVTVRVRVQGVGPLTSFLGPTLGRLDCGCGR